MKKSFREITKEKWCTVYYLVLFFVFFPGHRVRCKHLKNMFLSKIFIFPFILFKNFIGRNNSLTHMERVCFELMTLKANMITTIDVKSLRRGKSWATERNLRCRIIDYYFEFKKKMPKGKKWDSIVHPKSKFAVIGSTTIKSPNLQHSIRWNSMHIKFGGTNFPKWQE